MKVLLLQDIAKTGKKGEVKEVNQGHAMNFLIPRKMARAVSDKEIANLTAQGEQNKEKEEVEKDLAIKDLVYLKGKEVTLTEKANDKGHLFSQIHVEEILSAIKDQHGVTIPSDSLELKDPIKEVGEFEITAKVFGTKAVLTLKVEASK